MESLSLNSKRRRIEENEDDEIFLIENNLLSNLNSIDNSFILFALDQINDLVLLIEDFHIIFINKRLEKLIQINRTEIIGLEISSLPFFKKEDQEVFIQLIEQCKIVGKNGKKSKGSFKIHNYRRILVTSVEVTCSLFMDNLVCCIFRNQEPLKSQIDRLKWFDIYNELSLQLWSFIEFDDKEKDFYSIYMSKNCENFYNEIGIPKEKLYFSNYKINHLNKLSIEQIEWWVDKYQKINENNSFGKFKNIYINEKQQIIEFYVTIHFIGRSMSGNPQFLNIIEKKEMCNFTESQIYYLIKTLLETEKIIMGTVEMIDNDTDIIYMLTNQAMINILGKNDNPENSSKIRASSIGLSKEEIQLCIHKCRESKKINKAIQFEFYNHFTSKVIIFCVTPICENQFACIGIETNAIINNEKIEELVKIRTSQLEESLHLKSRFLAIMSHEIRTPLSGIMGILSLLLQSPLNSEQRDMVRISEVCGEQLLLVINDILDLTKMEENKMPLEVNPLSITNILEESLDVLVIEAEKKHIDLICDLDIGLSRHDIFMIDGRRVRQIVINLVSNAIKFSPENVEILLQASAKELITTSLNNNRPMFEILISIKDKGIGIPEQAKQKIFQPFTQADLSHMRKGSGLGLTISKKLAELMGGKMWFESEEGKGSVFYFTIRTYKYDEEIKNTILNNINFLSTLTPKPKYILIVDKCPMVCHVLYKKLNFWGFSPVTIPSNNLMELFEINQKRFHLVMIDARFGKSIIEHIQSLNQPIVVMGYPSELFEYSSIPCLKKPIHDRTLQSYLIEFFKQYQQKGTNFDKHSSPIISPKQKIYSTKILIAEDNIMNQRVIKKLLEGMGYVNIDIAENGQEALEATHKNNYDVILMDCMMPIMNGIEATERIRHDKNIVHQPIIIALTADAFLENKQKCLQVGMNDVLTKPIHRNQLIEALKQYTQK